MRPRHLERHRTERIGWLRAAVLGANDGIVSTASLIVGVAAAGTAREEVLVAGLAALVAGAMSMAAGEYVSVSSQSDTERADLERERAELAAEPEAERRELIGIYRQRGLSEDLAAQVAEQLMAQDALKWVVENMEVELLYLNGQPFEVAAPNFVELTIAKSDPGVKGDTAQGATKPATLETGAVIQVPLFIEEGQRVKVDTRTREYLSRA